VLECLADAFHVITALDRHIDVRQRAEVALAVIALVRAKDAQERVEAIRLSQRDGLTASAQPLGGHLCRRDVLRRERSLRCRLCTERLGLRSCEAALDLADVREHAAAVEVGELRGGRVRRGLLCLRKPGVVVAVAEHSHGASPNEGTSDRDSDNGQEV
jgi:hypothetical protein